MKTIQLIDHSGSRFFQRRKGVWQASARPARKDTLWMLFDLPEETLEVVDIPRLFGSDRSAYIERRLVAAFHGSPYRTAYPLAGGLLSSGKIMLNGIITTKDIESSLENMSATLAGMWGSAALLGLMARKNAPPDVMLALPGKHQLRIVVMQNHVPVLTRCVLHETANDANEILLTRQYLENQRIIERGKPLSLLFLGDSEVLGSRLSNTGIMLLPTPKAFAPKGDAGWLHAIFERLVASPPCQLAPLPLRAHHHANNLRQFAYLGAIASVATALFINESDIRALYVLHERTNSMAADIQHVTAQRDHLAELLRKSETDPELMRRATQFEMQEITTAPSANGFLQVAASAIANLPAARIQHLTFQALPDSSASCINSTATRNEPSAADSQRHAQIQFTILMPGELSSREKAEARKRIAASLKSIDGVTILQDPSSAARNAVIKGGAGATDAAPDQWCLSMPWKTRPSPTAEQP